MTTDCIISGISYLSWTTYIRQNFESVSKLINKVGKVPNERLCIQESNLNHLQIPIILKYITQFLNIMIESSIDKEGNFISNQEVIWQNEVTGVTPSLVSLALSQPVANEDLLLLHYQLSVSLYIIAALNVRYPKVFSTLFDNSVSMGKDKVLMIDQSCFYRRPLLPSKRNEGSEMTTGVFFAEPQP